MVIAGTALLIGAVAVTAALLPPGARVSDRNNAGGPPSITTSSNDPADVNSLRSPAVRNAAPRRPAPTAASKSGHTGRRPSAGPAHHPVTKAPLTYTVRPGDTLFGIAAWFKLHGYGDLYAANAKVIGADPSLIRPGERITIGTRVMKMQGSA